ncbi:MAG: polyhydroxyalkanoate synthesis regulator DNA-binding domain-containing protein [Caldilineaceae bacterium]|nr:polyhydroxyalkanoate synthesis regulator DNA-binding domain-containing protein [Caldilineaceae bacterium]MCB9140157.1 polyhydroxyalkanoate synthesis regulator DNA-binding domain-containing protein [Caldilineaceae bacterium]
MLVIKRYPNRKLYNTESKRYVTLDEITELIQAGNNVQVIDHESGDDLTTLTLTQIILEQEKKSAGFLPHNLLINLIRTGGDTVEQMVRSIQAGISRPAADKAAEADSPPDEAKKEKPGVNGLSARAAERIAEDIEDARNNIERARQLADDSFAEMLHWINMPSRKDVEKLQVQLAVLSQRLEEMLEQDDEQLADEKSISEESELPSSTTK